MRYTGLFAGLTTIDIQYFVHSFPASNTKIKTAPPQILVGGPATNAAVAFSVLNGSSCLASATGRNPFKTIIQNDLNDNRITHFDFIPSAEQNPVLASVVTSYHNGDRNIFTHHPEEIIPEVAAVEIVKQVKPNVFLMDGFYAETVAEAAAFCKKSGIPVVTDCGSWKPQYEFLLELTDVAICSSDFLPPGCKSADDVFKFLQDKGISCSAVSRGGNSLIYNKGMRRGEVSVAKVNVIDTLGAGDFLHGAFCYYYLRTGHDFETALQQAATLATYSCQFGGTRSWILSYMTMQSPK